MGVAKLVERLLPIPEVCGSNPVINKNLFWTFYCQLYWNDKNKETKAGDGPFLKKMLIKKQFLCNRKIRKRVIGWRRSHYTFTLFALKFLLRHPRPLIFWTLTDCIAWLLSLYRNNFFHHLGLYPLSSPIFSTRYIIPPKIFKLLK